MTTRKWTCQEVFDYAKEGLDYHRGLLAKTTDHKERVGLELLIKYCWGGLYELAKKRLESELAGTPAPP